MLMTSRLVMLGLPVVAAAAVAAWMAFWLLPTGISASKVLANARTKNAAVETYKFTMELWQTPQVEGDPPRYQTLTEGVVVSGEGMHVVVRGGDGSCSESLLLPGSQYHRDRADGPWEVNTSSFDVSQMPRWTRVDTFRVVDDLIDAAILGEETLHGVSVTKVIGRVDMEARVQSIWGDAAQQEGEPREQMLAGIEEFVGWIGVDDGLVHAIEVSASFPGMGEFLPFQYWYRVAFSEFNEPLDLPSVEDSRTSPSEYS